MSEYPSYLIHYGIQGQKWGVRRFQNEDGTLTPEGIKRYANLLDKSEKSNRYKKKLNKFEDKTDIYGNKYAKTVKDKIIKSKRFDVGHEEEASEHAFAAADKRREGRNPISDVKKYVKSSLETATKLVNGDTGEQAQKIVQNYMNKRMNGLNYIMWEVGDFNSELDKPGKYNDIDYSYHVKNKKISQKKWKYDK